MKTNIRFLVMIAVSLLTVLGMSAQEPFFLHKEGVKLTYADKDKKGKINSYTETTATKVTGDADNCTVTYSMMVMDNKKNPVLKQPMTQTFEVKNGTVTYDPKSLVGQIKEGMQVTVTGTPFQLPSNVKVGDTFGDYTITLNLAGIKTNTEVTGVKAVAEDGTTPRFRIDEATGYWQVSYDGGTSFENVKDTKGQPVKAKELLMELE